MPSNRLLVLGLIVTALVAAGFLLFGPGGEAPVAPQPRVEEQPAAANPTAAPIRGDANAVSTDATGDAARVAVAAGSGVDERLPGLVGCVVGPDGRPIAGAKVSVAPGVGFADANGGFDFGNLEDFADGGFEPGAMLRSVREQLADRVEVETDTEGRFRAVARGTSRTVGLRVLARGHGVLDRRFDRPREQDVDVGTLTLQAAAIVSGRVLTPAGAPVAGARVGRVLEIEQRFLGGVELDFPEMGEIETLRGGEGAVTDELGQFELAHVAPGELTLRARHPEHPTARSQPLRVEAGRELRSVLLTMQLGGVIAGVVNGLPADAKGLQVMAARKPKADSGGDATGTGGIASMMGNLGVDLDEMLGDVGLGFAERTAAIGTDGRFEVRGLARDTWRVWVARTSGGFAGGTACSARVEASPGDTVQLLFEAGITVTFTVADAKSSAPVERLVVRDRLRGGGPEGGIAAMIGGRGLGDLLARRPANYPDGAVTVANLRPKPEQKLTLTIEAIGYAAFERTDIELPKTGNLDLGVLKLEPVPVLQITVVAADHGRPVPGARVRFAGNGAGTDLRGMPRESRRMLPGGSSGLDSGRTDQDGRIALNRPQQAATIEVEARGFAPFASESIAFAPAGPDAFTAQLRVGGAVAVTVCDPAEKPVAGALVEHRSPAGDVASRKADAQGIARFDNLAPGTHQFRLGKEGGGFGRMMRRGGRGGAAIDGNAAPAEGAQPWQPVDVADKATAALRLVAQPTSTLRGIVRENGVPLADALVTFREGAATGGGDPMADALGGLAERFAGRAGGGGGGGASRSPRTDEQGLYQLRDLPAGEHHLRITHGSRAMPVSVAVVLRDGDNVFDVPLETATLRGVVKDSQGNPVSGASIRVRRPRAGGDPANEIGDAIASFGGGRSLGGGGTNKTDANGAFELRGIEPDVELELHASAKDFAPTATRVTAARGGTTEAPSLVLVAAGKVRVAVAGGQPFGAVRAQWLGQGEAVAPVLGMLRRGASTLEGLRPGTWEITVESMESLGARFGGRVGGRQGGQQQQPAQPAPPQQKRTVEVVAGQTIDVEL